MTYAVDELAVGSDREFNLLGQSLQDKLESALRSAQRGDMVQLESPAELGYFTGVPVEDLKELAPW